MPDTFAQLHTVNGEIQSGHNEIFLVSAVILFKCVLM